MFLQHGLEDSSTTWVVNLWNESLAFILADAGYDVWCVPRGGSLLCAVDRGLELEVVVGDTPVVVTVTQRTTVGRLGNNRGNIYSDRHVKYNYRQKEFWDWSMDQMAHFDVPAMVDFALNASGAATLAWVGHSQGTMQMFFALASPAVSRHVAARLNLFVALAPVAYVHHLSSPLLRVLADLHVDSLVELLGVQGFFFNDTQWIRDHLPALCAVCASCCDDVVEAFMGDLNRANLNASRLPLYLGEYPAGTSTEDVVHFAQLVRANKVAMYDYGSARANRAHYNQTTPPEYALTLAGVPTAFFTGAGEHACLFFFRRRRWWLWVQ